MKFNSVEERFMDKVAIIPFHTCWEWLGSKTLGYGTFYTQRQTRAHRVSYELFVSKIPNGLLVCHKCDNRGCVRPDHLFLGTYLDNNRDCVLKGRKADVMSTRTHCPKGHEYSLINTYLSPKGFRNCKACRKETNREWWRKKYKKK